MIYYVTADGIESPWVAVEMEHMRKFGIPCQLVQMRPANKLYFSSDWARRINDEAVTLYPLPKAQFALSVVLAPFLFRTRFVTALLNGLFGRRENLRNRIAALFHLLVAAHWVRGIRSQNVSHIHCQWIHACGTIGMYGAWLLGKTFSFTGHAADLFRNPVALKDKVERAEFIVAISEFHREFYRSLGAPNSKIHTVHCGIDITGFTPVVCILPESRPRPRVITLGRYVEKKGFDRLIAAVGVLRRRGVNIECVVAGSGPLGQSLESQVRRLSLEDRVTVTNRPVLQEELNSFMSQGDVFAQPCVVAVDGDVDGTPRTLMEAMACGLPAIATRVAGIPDIIEDGKSGILVPPNDVYSLADAIEQLIEDPKFARRLGSSGRNRIHDAFKLPDCLVALSELFRARLVEPPTET
jgi:glycosyltransferase involved in cell wall biosynthesis